MAEVKMNLNAKYSKYGPHLEDIVFYLKNKLSVAMAEKRPNEATLLQEQLWTLKDYMANHLRDLNEKRLEEVFEVFEKFLAKPVLTKDEEDLKKLKSLKKKRDQILKLIERKKNGENLEQNQVEKIKTLPDIEDEIAELE